jgi:hypothetical protein
MNNIQQVIQNFFTQASDVNYNFIELYHKAPTATIGFVLLILAIIFIPIVLYILIKKAQANKVVNKLLKSDNIDEFDLAFIQLLEKIDQQENSYIIKKAFIQKDLIEQKYFEFVDDVKIKDKIVYIQSLANKYNELANKDQSSKAQIKTYFEQRAIELVEQELPNQIKQIVDNCKFWEEDIEDIYAIVEYANTLDDPNSILDNIKDKISHLNFGNDILAVKFTLALEPSKAIQIYDYCIEKLENRFNQDEVISTLILDIVYDSSHIKLVYKYISNISDQVWIDFLYNKYFSKKDDFELDLSFIENDLISNEDHKEYLVCETTNRWKDIKSLEHICKNKHTVNILGHDQTRKIISRTDELNYLTKQSDAQKTAEEALKIAQEALKKLHKLENTNLEQE